MLTEVFMDVLWENNVGKTSTCLPFIIFAFNCLNALQFLFELQLFLTDLISIKDNVVIDKVD